MKVTPSTRFSRRDSLRLAAGVTTFAAMMQTAPTAQAAAQGTAVPAGKRLTFAQVQALSPLEMASRSPLTRAAYDFLLQSGRSIGDAKIRTPVLEALAKPIPTILQLYPTDAAKEKVRQALLDAKLLTPETTIAQMFPPGSPTAAPQPFLGTVGSGFGSHHAYPGGLGTHVALNVRTSLGLLDAYATTNAMHLNRDVVLAADLLHDIHKPWIFQWLPDGSPMVEYKIAGTGVHHIMSIAETIHRGLPAEVVVALASAHDNPGAEEAKIVAYLKAGAMIAGVDPVKAGYLAPSGDAIVLPRRIEGFAVFLGDHEWVVSVPAAGWAANELQEVAARDYGLSADDMKGAKFNALRNYVFAHTTIIGLHQRFVSGGKEAVRAAVNALVAPV